MENIEKFLHAFKDLVKALFFAIFWGLLFFGGVKSCFNFNDNMKEAEKKEKQEELKAYDNYNEYIKDEYNRIHGNKKSVKNNKNVKNKKNDN